jgi:bacteriocin-like protein
MFKEINNDEMMSINGGGAWGIAFKVTKAIVKHNATTPYKRKVHRGGKVYNVSYNGNWNNK